MQIKYYIFKLMTMLILYYPDIFFDSHLPSVKDTVFGLHLSLILY